ncbi:MAG: tetratricopeptide repeat protein, partial [Bacteroidia bacterium]
MQKETVSKLVLLLVIFCLPAQLVLGGEKEPINPEELIVKGYSFEELKTVGLSSYYSGNYPLALACYKRVLKTYVDNKDEEQVRTTRIFLAEILRGAQSYETALLILQKVKNRI